MNNQNKMPTFARRALASAITSIYISGILAPVYASDTEIYTQVVTSAANAPTVMMVLDTSGSMQWCMDATSSSYGNKNGCTDPNNSRVSVLKSALKTVLKGDLTVTPAISPAPGYVKMGYARFNPAANKGGWVRYPARPLDALVEIAPDGSISEYGLDTKSDTVQTLTTPNGINDATLTVGLNSNVGLSFADVMLPKGAEVTEAYIELTAAASDSSTGDWRIEVEDSGAPEDYTNSSVNSRTYASLDLDYTPTSWASGTKYQIPVKELVNHISTKSSWCGGNRVNFKISNKNILSTMQRRALSFADSTNKPRLFVRYTVDPTATNSCIKVDRSSTFVPANGNDDGYYYEGTTSLTMNSSYLYPNYVNAVQTGNGKSATTTYTKLLNILRIPSIIIGKGAAISSAKLVGYSTANQTKSTVQPMKVEIFDTDNVTSFCPSTCSVPSYSTKVLSSNWTGPVPKDVASEIDVTGLVQDIVNKSGWASNNAMGFRLSNTTNTSDDPVFYSREGSASKSMALSVSWKETITDLSKLMTVRDDILKDLDLTVEGGTPLGAAYAEASRYMLGMTPDVSYTTTTLDGTSYPVHDPRTLNSAKTKFVSPVDTQGCSGNYIFMMSDGEPNDLANVNSNTKGITGASCSNESTVSGNGKQLNWYCMFDLAAWNLKSSNQIGASIHTTTVYFGPNKSSDTGIQTTIDENVKNMKTVATQGDGDAFQATDKAKLVDALSKTVKKAIEGGGTIAAPGVAVNQLNRLNHLDQLYYAVFDPKASSYTWDGNLKRYKLKSDGSAIVDMNGDDAIDPTTGFFKKNTKSFWSTTLEPADGDQTVEGGAARRLPKPDASSVTDTSYRHMYTYTGSLSGKNQPLEKIDLSNSTFNTNAMSAMGESNSTIYQNLMNWYKGYVVPDLGSTTAVSATSLRKRLGGALHSQPILINYGYNGDLSTANLPENQKNYLFVSTLEGTLHAVDANTGVEKFSFIPGEKLSALKNRYNNINSTNPGFGMDLTWTFMRKDTNQDGQISSGDKLYIYGGMRMGGSNYYALDVSNLDSPKLLFAIQGGVSGNAFARMGQTWSQPVVTTMRVANVLKQVLIFGGGYDDVHETADQLNTSNNKGNLLYIVDAETGDLIWYASGSSTDSATMTVPDMKFSVPTTPNAVDLNGDGLADSIYFGDLGGQIFRADVNNFAASDVDLIKRVKLVAKLGETQDATTNNQRRFYEKPAVALFTDTNGQQFATIAQGSGYRSHPLNKTIDENFFVVFDYDLPRADLLAAQDSELQAVVIKDDLAQLDLNSTAVQTNGVTLTAGQKGWYVDFPEAGEKNLATSLIFKKKLVFTTYVPDTSANAKCAPVVGKTKMYTFCMPYGKLCTTTSSYAKDNVMIGLAGEPQLMIIADPDNPGKYKTVVITGTGVDKDVFSDVDVSPKIQPLNKWREKTKKTTASEVGK